MRKNNSATMLGDRILVQADVTGILYEMNVWTCHTCCLIFDRFQILPFGNNDHFLASAATSKLYQMMKTIVITNLFGKLN